MKTNSLRSHKPLTKLQIETASEMLRNALKTKKREIAQKAYKTDVKKLESTSKAMQKKIAKMIEEGKKFKELLKAYPKLKTNLGGYGQEIFTSSFSELATCAPSKLIAPKERNYGADEAQSYEPALPKESKQVEDFILGMKLGTVLMEDLQTLIKSIENI